MSKIINLKEAFVKNTNYQDKIFRHKLKKYYRTILAVILLITLCMVLKVQIENKVYTEAVTVSKAEKVGTQASSYLDYNGNILVYSKDGISAYNSKNEQLFNQTYEMQSPLVNTAGDYVVVADYKGSYVYVLDSTGLKGQFDTNMMIQSISVSEGGVVTAVLDDEEVTWVSIYSQTGNLIAKMRTTMNMTGYPLAYAMSPDNIKLAVSYLTSQGGQVNSRVAFYNFGDVGQNESERLVSAEDFTEQIIPFVAYPQNDTAIVLSGSKLAFFKGKQIPKLSESVELKEEVQAVYYNEKQVALIFNNSENDDKYRIITYDFNGKVKIDKTFDMEYTDVVMNGDEVLIHNSSDLLVLNKNEEVKFQGKVSDNILALITTDSKTKFIVVTDKSIDHIELK